MLYSKHVDNVISTLLDKLNSSVTSGFITSAVLYGSAATKEFIEGESDIDLMVVVSTNSGHIDVHQLQILYDTHRKFVEEASLPIGLYVYGDDEIPTDETIGYNLLRTLFIYDYKAEGILLQGKDIIQAIPEPHLQLAAIKLANDFKRGLRMAIANSPYLSNAGSLKMLIGDRAGGTTHVTQNILLGVDDLLRWASYSAIIVAKCALAYDGEIVTGKNKIGHIYLERNKYPEAYLFEPIYRWWIKHKSKEYERWNLTNIKISLDVPINEGVDLIMKALQFIETTSYRLENLSRHRDRIAIPED